MYFNYFLLFFLSLSFQVPAKTYTTVYGALDVKEDLLIELIESPIFQRLKGVQQYGVGHYVKDKESYSRYEHCMGVFHLLRSQACSLEEQVAGLLHDVSHTAFSHLGDHFFNYVAQKDSYQDLIHENFLYKSGLHSILERHGWTVERIQHKSGSFIALEQDLPHLCADRIEYNLQGAFLRGWINQKELQSLFEDLEFDGKNWSLSRVDLVKKWALFPLYMTEHCWSSVDNHLANEWLSKALVRSMHLGILSLDDLYYGEDLDLWQRLELCQDSEISAYMQAIKTVSKMYCLQKQEEKFSKSLHIPIKFRGINPLLRQGHGELKSLMELSPDFAEEYENRKKILEKGWDIVFQDPVSQLMPEKKAA